MRKVPNGVHDVPDGEQAHSAAVDDEADEVCEVLHAEAQDARVPQSKRKRVRSWVAVLVDLITTNNQSTPGLQRDTATSLASRVRGEHRFVLPSPQCAAG